MSWIVVDGIDATGKSTLVKLIAAAVKKRGSSPTISDEFSNSFIGKGIKKIVREKRFFQCLNNIDTPTADLFAILADVFCKYEVDQLAGAHDVVVSDREIISALAYQLVRLERGGSPRAWSELESNILNVVGLLAPDGKWPDLHVTLVISSDELSKRIDQRGEPPLSPQRLDELLDIQKRMQRFGPLFRAQEIRVDN